MAILNTTITREDEYEIEFDDSIWTKEVIKEFTESFYPTDKLEDMAKDIVFQLMRFGTGNFYEGFGRLKTIQTNGSVLTQFSSDLRVISEEEYTKGILVKIISEDDDFDYQVHKKS